MSRVRSEPYSTPGAVSHEAGGRGARVEVEALSWRPFGRKQAVLSNLNLTIEPGSRVLLAGPSGSGKSTLLRALAGLLEVADAGDLSGSVLVDGVAPSTRPGLVGLVLQDPGAGVVASTLARDVAFGPENLGMPRADIAPTVTTALAHVGLTMSADGPTSALSGGEQQRLSLAGALALRPRLLLLDEPTAMLDPVNAASVRAAVRSVVERSALTTVIVEHRLEPWLDFADRLVVFDASGAVIADGTPAEIIDQRANSLLTQGIWVPGYPAPAPIALAENLFGLCSETAVPRGETVMAARGVTVRREKRSLNRPPRVTTALQDVSVDAVAGSALAVVGPSGAGKSTLLTVLTGLFPPTTGSVQAHPSLVPTGTPTGPVAWLSTDLARAVAWVPQSAGSTVVARTVLDEVMATPRALGRPDRDYLPRARALLTAVSLDALAGADPRQLSGGELRRLAMVSAVVHRPALLLTDEPTIGQDRLTWAAVMGVAEALRRSGSAVVHATHDDAVIALADDVLRLEQPPDPRASPVVARPDAAGAPALRPLPIPLERRSLAGRCGPLALLLTAALALPAALSVTRWQAGATLLAAAMLLSLVALAAPGDGIGDRPRGRLSRLARRLVPGVLGALSVGWSAWLLGGHSVATGMTAFLRILVLVYPSAVLLPFVDTDRLAEHLAQRLRLPARPVVAASAALQRVQSIGELWAELTQGRRVRGLGPGRSPYARLREVALVTFGALVDSLAAAGRLAVAMDARGFASARRRTWLDAAAWRRADTAAVALGGLLPVVGLLLARMA